MIVDAYKSTSASKYLIVPAGTDIYKIAFPDDFDPDLKSLATFKKEFEIDESLPLVGMSVADVIAQIKERGWAVQGVSITVKSTSVTSTAQSR